MCFKRRSHRKIPSIQTRRDEKIRAFYASEPEVQNCFFCLQTGTDPVLDTLCSSLISKRVDKRKVQRENDSKIPLLHVTGCAINCVYLQRIGAPSQTSLLLFALFEHLTLPIAFQFERHKSNHGEYYFCLCVIFCMVENQVMGLPLARVPRVSQVILTALKQLN